MKIDGKTIAREIRDELQARVSASTEISLDIVSLCRDKVIETFIAKKKKFGEDLGINVRTHYFDWEIAEDELIANINQILENSNGMVIQLPLPEQINSQKILNLIPPWKDVDVLGECTIQSLVINQKIFPPVVGAVREVLIRSGVDLTGKNIAVVGYGKLVGEPVSLWLRNAGIPHSIIDRNTGADERREILKNADIIISGTGQPHSILPEEIRDGVVLIDAGTSELAKRVAGDIDPRCYERASIYTPVPGGIGPITIAILFRNLIENSCK